VSGGHGSVTAASTSSTAGCSAGACGVDPGSAVTLTAKPDFGYQVASWSGACSGNANTCTLTNIQQDKSATVSFTLQPLTVVGGTLSTPVSCGARTGKCTGTVTVSVRQVFGAFDARSGGKRRTRLVVIARGHFTLTHGQRAVVNLHVTPAGRRLENARNHRSLAAVETIRERAGGRSQHAVHTIHIKV
jgi:hypothetical protein